MLTYIILKKDLVNIAQKHVAILQNHMGLKRDMVVFGVKQLAKNLVKNIVAVIITSGKEIMLVRLPSILLWKGEKENLGNVNTVARRVNIKLMTGQMLTTNIREILMTILDYVVRAIENMMLKIMVIRGVGIKYYVA